MGFNLSISSLVVIMLCLVAFISGSALLVKVSGFGNFIPNYPVPKTQVMVSVYPTISMPGTKFLVKAVYPALREEQDLMLYISGNQGSEKLYLFDDGKHNDEQANDGLYAGIYDSSGKSEGIYEIMDTKNKLTEFTVKQEECELISGNSNDDNINFVVLPYGYDDYSDFRSDVKFLITSVGGLLDTEPFKTNKNKFSFSIVNPNKDLECDVGCKGVSALVCCDNAIVFQEASKCHYDSVLVLVNDDKLCGSASNYAKICAKNKNAKLILLHELGHSFADLADEYTYSDYYGDYNIGKINNVNCDEEGCSKWSSSSIGCFAGCTYSNLYRPQEKDSIMLDLYPEYNEVSKNHIINLINDYNKNEKETESLLPGKKSYQLVFNYNNESIKITQSTLKPIKASYSYLTSDYHAKLISSNNEVLYSSKLYVPEIMLPIPGANSSIAIFNNFNFLINMPYSNQADKLILYKGDEKLEEVSLAIYNNNCGNNFCDSNENHVNCVIDCDINLDAFCQTSVCDENCPMQAGCTSSFKTNYLFHILLIVVSLFVMILIFVKSYNKGKQLKESEYVRLNSIPYLRR